MKKNLKIKKAIKRKFPTIQSGENLATAINRMAQNDVSVLVVKDEAELKGLVTVSDMMHGLANDYDLKETKISTFLTGCEINNKDSNAKLCIQLDEDQDVISAIKVMYEGGINHLFVTGSDNRPLGVVSSLDMIKLIATE